MEYPADRLIVDELFIRQILSARTRRRNLVLPVRWGPQGELLRCPMRENGVYRLVPRGRLEHKRRQAEREPTRARQVLAFVDLCDGSVRTERQVEVTVTAGAVLRTDRGWVVAITPGDLSGQLDRDVFLAGSDGDYTFTASRQAIPGDPAVMMPTEKDMERARRMAKEKRAVPALLSVQALRSQTDTLADAMLSMKARNRVKLIAKELERLEGEVAG